MIAHTRREASKLGEPTTAGAVLAIFLGLVGACGTDAADPPDLEPGAELVQKNLTDTNPDPDIVEVELAAASGTARYIPDGNAKVWGYRDAADPDSKVTVPGPRLELRHDQQVIVHFTNELPEATTIHWHGLRVPNRSDGTLSVQLEVAPGESFDYTFVASDAGTFWYHPHVRSDEQIERGLYGVVRVHGGTDVPVTADRTFVLDDVKLESSGRLSESTTSLDVMLGRQGNVVLVNGVRSGHFTVRSGARERWRFVNSANGRYFNLRLQGHGLHVIGWDGGLLAEPYDVETLLIAPGERYEALVTIDRRAGSTVKLETIHYDRGHEVPDPGPITLFTATVQGTAAGLDEPPATLGDVVDLSVPQDAGEQEIELAEQENPGGFPGFFVNGDAFPDVPPIRARSGEVEVWRVYNSTEMDHPFHLHGMFFRVLDVDGDAPAHDGWKDTVNVPRKQTLRLGVRYGEAGTWMYHCHILEHAERGMMGEVHIAPTE